MVFNITLEYENPRYSVERTVSRARISSGALWLYDVDGKCECIPLTSLHRIITPGPVNLGEGNN